MGQEKNQGLEGKALETMQEKIGDKPVEGLQEKSAEQEVPAEVDRIVLKACSFNPEDRFQNADEMRAELREYKRKQESEERIRKKASMNQYFVIAGELED